MNCPKNVCATAAEIKHVWVTQAETNIPKQVVKACPDPNYLFLNLLEAIKNSKIQIMYESELEAAESSTTAQFQNPFRAISSSKLLAARYQQLVVIRMLKKRYSNVLQFLTSLTQGIFNIKVPICDDIMTIMTYLVQ